MPIITIDNQTTTVPPGTTLLAAAGGVGITIPALCWQPGQRACTSCLVCVVRVDGGPRLVPACATVAREGMVVESEVEDVLAARRTALELLLSDHLGDCEGPCRLVCPAHMDIPTMIRHLAAGRLREAITVIKAHIPLPATLGRICPELCEKGCRRAQHDGAVAICHLKRYAADADLAGDPYRPPCAPASGKRTAIIGAGPAGLTAAYELCRHGHACTLFDARPQPGGILREAIAAHVLPPEVLDAEIGLILDLGVAFVGNTLVADPAALLAEYDAVLIAAGHLDEDAVRGMGLAWSGKGIAMPGHSRMTAVPGLFACGGALGPLRHAVRAVADGHAAARAIDAWLAGLPLPGDERLFSVHMGRVSAEEMGLMVRQASEAPRATRATSPAFALRATADMPPDSSPARGGEIQQQDDGLTDAEAVVEAARCLHCDCRKLAECRLRAAAMALGVPANPAHGERRPFTQDDTHPAVLYEAGKCITCGLCVQIAEEARETLGLAFIGRGFDVRVATPFQESLAAGLRVVADACVAACPTGALARRDAKV